MIVDLAHNGFLDTIPKAWATKEKDKLDFIKIKNCASNDTLKKVKRQLTEWGNIFSDHTLIMICIQSTHNSELWQITQLKIGKGSEETFLQRRKANVQ